MINFTNIILEGRYDSLTRKMVNDVMKTIKDTSIAMEDVIQSDLPQDINGEDAYEHESGIDISVAIFVQRMDRLYYGGEYKDFHINTFIDEQDELVMEITIDRDKEPQCYERMFYKINEDIRHEIEHYTQQVMDSKPKDEIGTANLSSYYEHHNHPTEIPALVHGFYRRAKLEKLPLDVIMLGDLNSDIKLGHLTQEEADSLLVTWINYARRRLPQAIYSNK